MPEIEGLSSPSMTNLILSVLTDVNISVSRIAAPGPLKIDYDFLWRIASCSANKLVPLDFVIMALNDPTLGQIQKINEFLPTS